MAISTALGYNTGSTITGTQQIGSLAITTATTVNYSPSANGGVTFWMGPDETLGYVVGVPVPLGNQTTPIGGVNAFLGFYRSASLTEASFVSLVNGTFNQSLTTGASAKTYLTNNGYWTSYDKTPLISGNPQLVFDFSSTSSYSNTGTNIADLSGRGNNGVFSTGTGNGSPTTVTGYNSNGYLNLPGTGAQLSVRLPDSLKPTGTANFTYIIYMRPRGLSYNGIDPGIMANHDGTNGFVWEMTTGQTFNVFATRNNSNITGMNFTGGTGFNVWSTYAVKFNGSSTTIYQYNNGILYSANTVGATSIVSSTSWGFFLGLRFNQWINADFNYVAMYDTALSDTQITEISSLLTQRIIA
jgi:hypothetical protein